VTVDEWVRDEPGTEHAETAAVRADILNRRLLSPNDLDRLPAPARLIGDYLVCNSLAALYGRPGVGKSFVAMAMAFSVASGEPFFGHLVERGPVLYVAAEGTVGLAQRQRAWRETNQADVSMLMWLPSAVSLIDPSWAEALALVVEDLRPILIVIDTLNRSMPGGDENSSADMGALIRACDRLREVSGATVLLVHHSPKSDGSTLRGHSALEGAVDTALLVQAAGDRYLTLSVAKQKDIFSIDGHVQRSGV
jgi:RecA-family ATPase